MSTDTVIVFGASRGLGEAIAWRLVEAGRAVAVVCRKASDAQGVADRIEAAGGRALALAADVTDFDAVKAGVEQASAWRGGIAAIVNNAGTIEPIALLGDTDPGAWARLISVNLVGAYHCIRASLPHLSANGVVVNLSSGGASHPMEGWSAYCASKAGLAMLTQSVALERPDLRVYGFRPGVVDTDMQGVIRASGINRISKLRREDLLRPRVPASGVAWLVQNAPADFSGQEVDIRDESFKARMAGSVAPTV
jgi:NAD(P)-dependent dehydrogenase (short-subunit alcohol dehydrogenase family)